MEGFGDVSATLTKLANEVHIRAMLPGDESGVVAMLWSRPVENVTSWKPTSGAQLFVAEDAKGVCGFLMARVTKDGIVPDQVECEYSDGKPTYRGKHALASIERFLHRWSDESGLDVYAFVVEDNVRHITALKGRDYERVPISIYRRKAKHG
jgi:hypothetical protein